MHQAQNYRVPAPARGPYRASRNLARQVWQQCKVQAREAEAGNANLMFKISPALLQVFSGLHNYLCKLQLRNGGKHTNDPHGPRRIP
eukprot:969701-Pleurochrysis_carterae.AAC.1